jgi:hypothetical protein
MLKEKAKLIEGELELIQKNKSKEFENHINVSTKILKQKSNK